MKWREGLLDRFDKSMGVANPLADWKNVERTQVEAALERIPRNHLLPLWDRLSRDVRGNSSVG